MIYTICTACEIHHYEDCPVCFGFGFHGDGVIMSAADACNRNYTGWIRCHECGSTPFGVPKDYDTDFKQRVLGAVSNDIIIEPTAGWVFWRWGEDHIHGGFLNAASLRVIAGELDRRNKELFG